MNSDESGGIMTGIVFTGGNGPPPDKIRALVSELPAERLIAAADSGLDAAEGALLKPDWIIGDMDSLSDPAQLDAYPDTQVLRYPAQKDYTDTELAFTLLAEKGCTEIWIVGGGGGRVDHLFGIRSMCERGIFPTRWILDTADIYCVQAPVAEERYALASAKADTGGLSVRPGRSALVSVFPLGNGPWKVLSRGLQWPLDDLKWDRGFTGLSNTAPDGEFFLNVRQGRFMVIVPHNNERHRSKT
jgi:thiamine pyrophosphokinase